jgi:hypothetical protein
MSPSTNLLSTAARGAEQLIAEVRSLQLSGPRAGVATGRLQPQPRQSSPLLRCPRISPARPGHREPPPTESSAA